MLDALVHCKLPQFTSIQNPICFSVSAPIIHCSHLYIYIARTGSNDYRSDVSIPMPIRVFSLVDISHTITTLYYDTTYIHCADIWILSTRPFVHLLPSTSCLSTRPQSHFSFIIVDQHRNNSVNVTAYKTIVLHVLQSSLLVWIISKCSLLLTRGTFRSH